MRSNRMVRRFAIGAAVALIVSACGGGDSGGSSEEQALINAMGDALWADMQDDGDLPEEINEESADCVAETVVETVGYEQLQDAGITAEALESTSLEDLPDPTEDLSDARAAELADGTLDCINFEELIAQQFAADGSVSEESARCVASGLLDEGGFREAMVEGMIGGDAAFDAAAEDSTIAAAMFQTMADCLNPDELSALMGG